MLVLVEERTLLRAMPNLQAPTPVPQGLAL
jgi:hypothetical protein